MLRIGIGFEVEFDLNAGDPNELREKLKDDILSLPYIKDICIDKHPLHKIPPETGCGGH